MPTGNTSFLKDAQGHLTKIAEQGLVLTTESYPILKNGYPLSISAASGGTQMPSLDVTKVTFMNFSGNGVMFLGGNDDDAPFSGRGFWLWPQNVPPHEHTCYVDNLDKVQVCATRSGQLLQYIAYVIGKNASLDPETMGIAPDSAPPYITTHTPTHLQSGLATNTTIIVNFNEPMLSSRVNESSLRLHLSGQAARISGDSFLVSTSGSAQIKFIPNSGQLAQNQWYQTIVASGIADVSENSISGGQYTFGFRTTGTAPPSDETGPAIESSTPVSGATNVSRTASMTVVFDEQVLSGTVNTGTFKLQNISGVAVTATSVTLATNRTTVTFDPASTLGYYQAYDLKVSGVKDLAGNFMTGKNIRFTTLTPSWTAFYSNHNTGSTFDLGDDPTNTGGGNDQRAGLFSDDSGSIIRGFIPKRAVFWLRKVGSPTGTIYCRVRTNIDTDDSIGVTLGQISATSLTTSYEQYNFINLSGTYTIGQDDAVLIEYYDGNGASAHVEIERDPNGTSTSDIWADWDPNDGYFTTENDNAKCILYHT